MLYKEYCAIIIIFKNYVRCFRSLLFASLEEKQNETLCLWQGVHPNSQKLFYELL